LEGDYREALNGYFFDSINCWRAGFI